MKLLRLALVLPAALLCASPVLAQDEELKNKSDQELKEELDKLTKDISEGMGEIRDDLYKAALPRRKMDELRADLKAMIEKIKQGEADELHQGMKSFLKANPNKLAELLDLNKDEATKLLENDSDLLKKLSEKADETAKLFRDEKIEDNVLRRQAEIERKLESVKKAFKNTEKEKDSITRVLDILQEGARRAKP